MYKYWFKIRARKIGAIGVWQTFIAIRKGTDYADASDKLYDEFEHICVLDCGEEP